ncbi:putative S-crystallin SL11-like [Apostichopus japonicus]|uniref:Putative S-crystallin SL11-like n=1 Tax=Stichopus japonicus TaxID=307972 RepID=A0A2G8KDZ8_STIJA|nr:putative S-crystallin SL11-like [Apostichopus japonicus]
MPSVRLKYFDAKGRAEPVRFMFALDGVDYEDIRYSQEEFAKVKATMPFGQVPVLEVDDITVPHSKAIYTFVAAQHGFLPADNLGRAHVDVVIETISDTDFDSTKWFFEQEELMKHLKDVTFPKMKENLEKILSENNGGLFGDKLSLADVITFSMLHDGLAMFTGKEPGSCSLSDYPLLEGFVARFKALPKIATYLEKRPNTPY